MPVGPSLGVCKDVRLHLIEDVRIVEHLRKGKALTGMGV